ncbi:hypothetical protein [Paraburkholderia sp. BCC1886]|uniref:hypothetical protein n=1 Tax=Paraburkholderia sp. BCC1886 TaxID=2562670 RepID=UPI0011829FBA|nr:hypothetical protein [Paraburkholderia sp. BCC1886]
MSINDMSIVARNRHSDALAITAGASNLSGVSRALVRAINQCHQESLGTQGVCDDPAIRLIVHQMAFLCKTHELDSTLSTYGDLLAICERLSKPLEISHEQKSQTEAQRLS